MRARVRVLAVALRERALLAAHEAGGALAGRLARGRVAGQLVGERAELAHVALDPAGEPEHVLGAEEQPRAGQLAVR